MTYITKFRDRAETGLLLAKKLRKYANRKDVLILALPRGGVPVGFEVANALNSPAIASCRPGSRIEKHPPAAPVSLRSRLRSAPRSHPLSLPVAGLMERRPRHSPQKEIAPPRTSLNRNPTPYPPFWPALLPRDWLCRWCLQNSFRPPSGC